MHLPHRVDLAADLRRAERRRRALAHQCPACRAQWALQVIRHPSGAVVNCKECGEIRLVSRAGPRLRPA